MRRRIACEEAGREHLTVYAHANPKSFCHAILDQFTAGLREAGHSNEVVDLYAIGLDPVHRPRDTPSWLTESIPDDVLGRMRVRECSKPSSATWQSWGLGASVAPLANDSSVPASICALVHEILYLPPVN
jgi:NAD(P)H dehydrogenase (quinone)